MPIGELRRALERGLARLDGESGIVVFGCDQGANVAKLAGKDITNFSLICTGMLPPSFIDYALRGGAAGVLVTGCRAGGCAFRLGNRWTQERLGGTREPHLRAGPWGKVLRVAWADRGEEAELAVVLDNMRQALAAERLHNAHPIADPIADRIVSSTRMTVHG